MPATTTDPGLNLVLSLVKLSGRRPQVCSHVYWRRWLPKAFCFCSPRRRHVSVRDDVCAFWSLLKSVYSHTLLLPSQERSTKLLFNPVVVVLSWTCLPDELDRVPLVSVGGVVCGYFCIKLVFPVWKSQKAKSSPRPRVS